MRRAVKAGFNTQPPEGGWVPVPSSPVLLRLFQHTAARRRLDSSLLFSLMDNMFQHTAARRRLGSVLVRVCSASLFQHTAARRRLGKSRAAVRVMNPFQHTAARRRLDPVFNGSTWQYNVSTHSRPKAAGPHATDDAAPYGVSTHSRPKAAGFFWGWGLR